MVDTAQIGRKLTYRRKERRLLSQAVRQAVTPVPPTPVQAPLPPAEFEAELDSLAATRSGQTRRAPAPGYEATVALFRRWEEEAARMTPEEIAADDAVSDGLLENVEKYPLSLRIPDLSGHD